MVIFSENGKNSGVCYQTAHSTNSDAFEGGACCVHYLFVVLLNEWACKAATGKNFIVSLPEHMRIKHSWPLGCSLELVTSLTTLQSIPHNSNLDQHLLCKLYTLSGYQAWTLWLPKMIICASFVTIYLSTNISSPMNW